MTPTRPGRGKRTRRSLSSGALQLCLVSLESRTSLALVQVLAERRDEALDCAPHQEDQHGDRRPAASVQRHSPSLSSVLTPDGKDMLMVECACVCVCVNWAAIVRVCGAGEGASGSAVSSPSPGFRRGDVAQGPGSGSDRFPTAAHASLLCHGLYDILQSSQIDDIHNEHFISYACLRWPQLPIGEGR